MRPCIIVWLVVVLALPVLGRAQDTGADSDAGETQSVSIDQGQVSEQTQDQNSDSTFGQPLSGMGSGMAGSKSAERDLLSPQFYVAETADTNFNQLPGVSSARSVTRLFGTLRYDRIRDRSLFKLAYIGGGGFPAGYSRDYPNRQIQELFLYSNYTWHRGELRVFDSASYLPEGAFGGVPFGGTPQVESLLGGYIAGLAQSHLLLFSPAQFGGLGQTPRITNTGLVEGAERLSARGTLTATAAYGFLHFTEGGGLNGDQAIGEIGYNYWLRVRDQVAAIVGYQTYGFTGIEHAFSVKVSRLIWAHEFSPRLITVVGGGPVITDFNNRLVFTSGRQLGWDAMGSVLYKRPRTSVSLGYLRFINGGSGVSAGATTDLVRISVTRQLTRTWSGALNGGFARNSALQQVRVLIFTIPEQRQLDHGYAGVRVSHPWGKHVEGFAFYNYGQEDSELGPICPGGLCGRVVRQHTGGLGLTWSPKGFRVD